MKSVLLRMAVCWVEMFTGLIFWKYWKSICRRVVSIDGNYPKNKEK